MATNAASNGVVFASIAHNGEMQTVALFPGLGLEELSSLLKTIFGIPLHHNIVGVNAERGLVIPLSLVCRSPTVIPNSICKLLLAPVPNALSSEVKVTDVVSRPRINSIASKEESQEQEEVDSTEFVMQEIIKFIDGLHQQKFLDKMQTKALSELLLENSTLLFAAYSVAVSANDSEYFAEICKDLAISMGSEQGRVACEAQDEVLQVCDQLYMNEKITENQLLYLRHLVLIREEAVAGIYDDFQEHQSVPLLAKALYELAITHPYQHSSGAWKADYSKAAVKDDDNDGEDDDEDDSESSGEEEDVYEKEKLARKTQLQMKNPPPPSLLSGEALRPHTSRGGNRLRSGDTAGASAAETKAGVASEVSSESSSAVEGLTGVLTLMIRTKFIADKEAVVLFDMIRSNNEYVMAAYELYSYDEKLDELQDTLLRCAKLEIRKKAATERENALSAAQKDMLKGNEKSRSSTTSSKASKESDNETVETIVKEDVEDVDDLQLEDIGLESILESLDVVNIWSNSVPEKFVHAVFIAVIRSQLSTAQAKALCDLFHADYDLVKATWEVFTVQKDGVDFIDSLRRIVRDLQFDEEGDQAKNAVPVPSQPEKSPSTSSGNAEGDKKRTTSGTQTAANSTKREHSSGSSHAEEDPSEVERNTAAEIVDRKKEAIAAVAAAKKDLLKHSLDMMVKQGLTSAETAHGLFVRYSHGDVLVDAAIEAYAADRDVAEFLDTLHILANNSKEDLDALMRQTEEEGPPPPTKPSASVKPSMPINMPIPQGVLDQLTGIVEELRKNDLISITAEGILRDLITKQDGRVIAAFKVYVQMKDGADLIDSLLRIAAFEISQHKPSPSNNSSTDASHTTSNGKKSSAEDDDEVEDGEEGEGNSSVLSAQDQKTVVEILLRASAVTAAQSAYLGQLIEQNNMQVRKVFQQYEFDKDVYKLIAALKEFNKPPQGGANKEEEGSENYEDDFEEDLDEDDRNVVETRFFGIIQGMNLSHLQTAALRLAIARDDEEIRSAIINFKMDPDEETLKKKLLELATKTINETLDENDEEEDGDDAGGEEAEAKDDEEEDDDDDDEEDNDDRYGGNNESKAKTDSPNRLSASHYQSYWNPNGSSSGNSFSMSRVTRPADFADDEDDEDDGDDEDGDDDRDDEDDEDEVDDNDDDVDDSEGSSGLLTSKSARDHVFPILIAELVKEGLIGKREGSFIMDQFNSGNPIISAALDVYDLNNDMSELVDTLQQAVSTQA